ncbi:MULTISPECIES: hypothetical protein [unclassified Aureimonas]|uniref:hypothetical protein n=1 Tax=unclassified Aureimonas TaxID=2615206 RepID=UPI0006FBAEAF|nr:MULTISPECIES: hypothetical protein [unclassified Aureimonas]KQT55204.1 hypothetical protein ASG62_10210 [Aureimonas sp. Leaf427]KQT70994.1 hypothetical protein ASG54_20595 [Aureimonas sp. Leaf460]
MDPSDFRQDHYTSHQVADALDVVAKERGLESRYAAMRVVIIQGLEAGGYLKRQKDADFVSTLSDDVTI